MFIPSVMKTPHRKEQNWSPQHTGHYPILLFSVLHLVFTKVGKRRCFCPQVSAKVFTSALPLSTTKTPESCEMKTGRILLHSVQSHPLPHALSSLFTLSPLRFQLSFWWSFFLLKKDTPVHSNILSHSHSVPEDAHAWQGKFTVLG